MRFSFFNGHFVHNVCKIKLSVLDIFQQSRFQHEKIRLFFAEYIIPRYYKTAEKLFHIFVKALFVAGAYDGIYNIGRQEKFAALCQKHLKFPIGIEVASVACLHHFFGCSRHYEQMIYLEERQGAVIYFFHLFGVCYDNRKGYPARLVYGTLHGGLVFYDYEVLVAEARFIVEIKGYAVIFVYKAVEREKVVL